MTAYASGTCDPLPWKLTSKHRGGISKILTPPSLKEHYVSMDKENAGRKKEKKKKTLWRRWGESRKCWEILKSSLFQRW